MRRHSRNQLVLDLDRVDTTEGAGFEPSVPREVGGAWLDWRRAIRRGDSNSLVPLGKVFFEKLWRPEAQFRFARDSPLEGDGFEPSVPRIGPTVVDITPPIAQTCFQCCRGRPGFEKSSIMAPHPAPCARSLLRPGAPPVVL